MVITCWSVKGGSGTTTVVAALACLLAARGAGPLVVDLAGDLPAALGRSDTVAAGVTDVLASSPSLGRGLTAAAVGDASGVRLVARGSGPWPASAGERLVEGLSSVPGTVLVDAGTVTPDAPDRPALAVAAASTHSLLVLRSCYLALRRAVAAPIRPSGVVLVDEPGRSLTRVDVESVLGVPVTAQVPWDAAISRVVDAGLLAGRLPSALAHSLRRAA